jgi:Zn-dependent metalloprotease
MDKRPLIVVSLCAVILLVLGSLSNVVGYQSVKSTVSESPLFDFRTQKAVNRMSESILTSNYLGKGINTISFPLREKTNEERIQEFIYRIRTMDENTFRRSISYVVNQIKHNDIFNDINTKEVINGLHKIRESKQNIIVYKNSDDNRRTYFHNFVPTACWIPGCLIKVNVIKCYAYCFIGTHAGRGHS